MLGLVFGWLAVHTEKKIGGSLLRAVFSCFYGQKTYFLLNIVEIAHRATYICTMTLEIGIVKVTKNKVDSYAPS